jgi:hypothetical protein
MGLAQRCAFEAGTAVAAAYFLLQRIVNVGRLAAAAAPTLAEASSSDKSDIYIAEAPE